MQVLSQSHKATTAKWKKMRVSPGKLGVEFVSIPKDCIVLMMIE